MASGASSETPDFVDAGNLHLPTNLEVLCPICLEFPHNAVLLQCSSYENGCRPFVCDTDHSHSNCLGRFRTAYDMPSSAKSSIIVANTPSHLQLTLSDCNSQPACPLCRGSVTGWIVVNKVRELLNLKVRCCEVKKCKYMGNYHDLHKHAKINHPNARPSEVDPAKQLEWDDLQQSLEVIDVLSTIHSEVPRGVVLGDYVIEYMDDDMGDEFEDFPGDEGNWWTSCILYHVFDNFRNSGNRRISRASEARRRRRIWQSDTLDTGEGSTSSVVIAEHRFDETDNEFVDLDDSTRGGSSYHSSRRRRLMNSVSRRTR